MRPRARGAPPAPPRARPPAATTSVAALLAALMAAAAVVLAPAPLAAQDVSGIDRELLEAVMPRADRFDPKAGAPPVIRAWDRDEPLGFVFLTRDVPPEAMGYSGPVEALVGMRLDGTLAGVRVLDYWESYRSSMGDFLRDPGVQEQFTGKRVSDAFQVNGDVKRVTRATISTQALARGIRDASRKVAVAYADEMDGASADAGPVDVRTASWFDLRTRGVLKRILIESREGHLDISVTWLPNDSLAEIYLGAGDTERIHAAAARAGLTDPTFLLYTLDGPRLRYFLRDNWKVAQDGDTVDLSYRRVYNLGLTEEGKVAPESTLAGVFMLEGEADVARPFSLLYALEGHEGYYGVRFDGLDVGEEPPATAAPAETGAADAEPAGRTEAPEEEAPEEAAPGPTTTEAEATPEATPEAAPEAEEDAPPPAADIGPAPAVEEDGPPPAAEVEPATEVPDPAAGSQEPLDLSTLREESELERTLAGTDWVRVARVTAVLLLGLAAFFAKSVALRWVSLAATLLVLGFLDAAFLSVSHVTAAIWVGPGVFLRDVPLLILASATLLTTLLWGRVFCGVWCPFGALQDVLERIVPARWRVRVPWAVHLRARWLKYAVLAGVVGAGLLGSRTSLYQYVEPFGTVFFPSRSLLLWSLAGLFLAGAVFVPRFYCRYVCPLGAGLGVLSVVAPWRIRRVPQCQPCRVCEQDCPTGAIQGPEIDFPECVRCNRCEVHLAARDGACRHDAEAVRSRLVQIEVPDRSRVGV